MKNEIICELTQDLLPNYLEGLTSPGSSEAIEAHLAQCADCQALLNEMKQGLAVPQVKDTEETSSERDIKPLIKLKKRVRTAVAVTVLLCMVVFGGGTYYFAHSFTPRAEDVTITCEKNGNIVDIIFIAKNKNTILNSYVGGYHEKVYSGEVDFIELHAFHKSPFKKPLRYHAYYSYNFIDQDTVNDSFGNKIRITDKSFFAVQFADQLVKISIADLYHDKITIL